MEWFWNVEVVSVRSSHLVGVQVLFIDPVSSIPKLTVTLVTSSQSVRSLMNLQFGTRLKSEGVVTISEVWFVVNLWVMETCTSGGGLVVFWLMVWCSVKHGTGSVTSACGVERTIVSWNKL